MLRAVGVLGWCLLLGSGGNVGGAAPGCVWWGRCDTVLSPASLGPTPTGLQLKLGWVGERKILRVAKSSSSRKQSGWFPLKTEPALIAAPKNFPCFGLFALANSAYLLRQIYLASASRSSQRSSKPHCIGRHPKTPPQRPAREVTPFSGSCLPVLLVFGVVNHVAK